MGQDRMLLLLVTVIFIAIAISVGYYLFSVSASSSNKDGLIQGISTLANEAVAFRGRPGTLGGGGGSYLGFYIPQRLASTDDGSYSATINQQSIVFIGTSKHGYGTVEATLDSTGALNAFTYTGDFQ